MANPQLTSYVRAQMDKQVPSASIVSALLGAGWGQPEIDEAMREIAATTPTQPSVTTSAASGSATPFTAGPAKSVAFIAPQTSTFTSTAASTAAAYTGGAAAATGTRRVRTPLIIAAALIVLVAAGIAAYLYVGPLLGLNGAATPAVQPDGAVQQAQADVERLTKQSADLQTQIGKLQADVADLLNNLSVFQASTTKDIPLTIRGVVTESKGQYVVTTVRGIVIAISNSKDAKVISALKTVVGADAEVTGTHPAGVAQLRLTSVNGVSIDTAPATATSTTTATTTRTTGSTTTSTGATR